MADQLITILNRKYVSKFKYPIIFDNFWNTYAIKLILCCEIPFKNCLNDRFQYLRASSNHPLMNILKQIFGILSFL